MDSKETSEYGEDTKLFDNPKSLEYSLYINRICPYCASKLSAHGLYYTESKEQFCTEYCLKCFKLFKWKLSLNEDKTKIYVKAKECLGDIKKEELKILKQMKRRHVLK